MHVGCNWFITTARFNKICDNVCNLLAGNAEKQQFYLNSRYCMEALKHEPDGENLTDKQGKILHYA